MASDDVQLLSFWSSPYVMRAQLALISKGVPFSNVEQDLPNHGPLLLKHNPVYEKVPVLLHRGKAVCESLIIIQYIDETFPPAAHGGDILPKDPYDRAIARFWADFIDKKILVLLYTAIFQFRGDERKEALKQVKENFVILEDAFGKVSKEPPFFGGSKPGYVDIVLAPHLAWEEAFEASGKVKFELEKLPRLAAWKKAMLESPLGQQLPAGSKVCEFFLTKLRTLGIPIEK